MTEKLPSIEDLLKQGAGAPAAPPPAAAPARAKAPKPTAAKPATTVLSGKLSQLELKGKEAEAESQAKTAGIPYIDLKGFPISADALQILSEEQARKLKAIVFLFTGPEIRIGAVNPQDEAVKELLFQLEERNKANGALYQISQQSFDEAVKLYQTLPKIKKVVKGIQITQEELDEYKAQMENIGQIQAILNKGSITQLLSIMMAAALKLGSSDIHIEAEEKKILLRLRIDGILQEVGEIKKEEWPKLINRIKLVAGLKMNISDRPQDGRFTIYQKDKKIDVRTSTLPTAYGESVVMRILNPESIKLKFAELGFRESSLKKLMPQIQKPTGMIVTTGPTGSGKTTTLYAILSRLNQPGVNIITLEDPIEYKLEGINQSQIDHSKDYTFAKGLRSILRQDPDIVMVGEIRDLETADTAIQAALTGHMLISTIHTNDAAGAIPRFISMGVKPFQLAPALNAIMGQRLARRICDACKKPAEIDEATMKRVNELLDTIPPNSGETVPAPEARKFMTGDGCDKCNGTGYKGRVGLYEILIKDEAIEQFILSGEISEYKVKEVAQKQGMLFMAQDGLLKALEGLTSVEEIKRVTGL